MSASFQSIKSPLQMVGFYLAWIETALAAGLFPLKENHGLQVVLLVALVSIAVIFALGTVFVLVYLVRFYPQWLFNPSDFDPDVQDDLLELNRFCENTGSGFAIRYGNNKPSEQKDKNKGS